MCPSDRVARPITAANADFKSAFDVIDADRDGKISGDDLRVFYAGFRGAFADDTITTMISVADSNKDGFVEYEEFEKVLEGCNGEITGRVGGGLMEDVFKVMDKDGDGRLSYGDLKSYMEWAGFAASDDEIVAMIKLAGGNERDGVSFDDLLKVFGCF